MNRHAFCAAAVFLACAAVQPARAQEPAYMEAATHPGAGQWYARLLAADGRYAVSSTNVDVRSATLKLSHGILASCALLVDADMRREEAGGDVDTGFSTATVRLKQRVFRHDLGPLDTWRGSVTAGMTLPGSDDEVAPEHARPRAGAVTTAILGRHGLNGQVDWREREDQPDVTSLNVSHLYRMSPAVYSAGTHGAWYTMLESLNDISCDGIRADLAFGLLYEARRWACEIGLRLPLADDGDSMPETGYECVVGFRYLP